MAGASKPQPFTVEQLGEIVAALEDAAAELKAVMVKQEEKKLETLGVRNAIEMRKGLHKVMAFAAAAKAAMRDEILGPMDEGK